LHRASHGGLRLDDEGLTVDPAEAGKMLRVLGLFTGSDADGARFMAHTAIMFDAHKLEALRRWRAAYLGRYMHQQITTIANIEVVELWAYVREITELIKTETPTVGMNDP